jgi:hypothetical protein
MTLPDRFEIVNKKVVICASVNDSSPIDINYLKRHEGWGYVKVRSDIVYFALYVGRPIKEIRYFGIIERIISPIDALSPVKNKRHARIAAMEGKKYIQLKKGTLVELQNPIGNRQGARPIRIQGHKIVDLQTFLQAQTLDDILR